LTREDENVYALAHFVSCSKRLREKHVRQFRK